MKGPKKLEDCYKISSRDKEICTFVVLDFAATKEGVFIQIGNC